MKLSHMVTLRNLVVNSGMKLGIGERILVKAVANSVSLRSKLVTLGVCIPKTIEKPLMMMVN